MIRLSATLGSVNLLKFQKVLDLKVLSEVPFTSLCRSRSLCLFANSWPPQ